MAPKKKPLPERVRIDRLLVERGVFESRAQAQAAIEAGLVVANATPVTKASLELPADAVLQAEAAHPFVSRGGVKARGRARPLRFRSGRLDLSRCRGPTGGFTDALLARGAARAYAVDVGTTNCIAELRACREVAVLEHRHPRTAGGPA